MDAKWSNFDRNWLFHLGDLPDGESAGHNDASWRLLDLPHDWMIEQPRKADNPSGRGGGFFPGNVGWYRKRFKALRAWSLKKVRIEFDGVYHNAEFWLNGRPLGRHPYGYSSFAYDLDRYLNYGGDNVLAVRVDVSSDPHTRWYSGAGIYRHVRLTASNPVHIPMWGVSVTTPGVSPQHAVVHARTRVVNPPTRNMPVQVEWTVTDPYGRVAGTGAADAVVPACGEIELDADIRIEHPALWSPDTPALYRLDTVLHDKARRTDCETTTFGIRWFSYSVGKGFELNGKPLLMRGGCVHHDCGPLGAASIDRAEERKVELMKASGYNAVRCAHNPPAPAFLDACDRLGMLVMDEAFDVWRSRKPAYDYHLHFDEWWRRDLESMVLRDRNHPSIVMWSIGNELMERALPEGADIARMLADHVRLLDPTRPVTAGICDIWNKGESWQDTDRLFEALDIAGYNYRQPVYMEDHKRHPDRIIVASETYPTKVYDYWRAVEKMPWVVGDFVWTALDYLGETGVGHTWLEGGQPDFSLGYPWVYANCGDIDLCGCKRPQSYYRDVVWHRAEKPFIAVHAPVPKGKKTRVSPWGWHDVQASWNWHGHEKKALQVDVYFDCDEIELILNGRSLGRRPAAARSRHIASFKAPYAPGELLAVAYRNKRAVSRSQLVTTGPAVALRLTSDRNPVSADRNDLAYIAIEAIDAEGRLVPDAHPVAYLSVSGPGTIAALASADPRNTETYRGNVHSLWRGRAVAIVQPSGGAGVITLRAQSDNLKDAKAIIKASVSSES